MSYSNNLFDKLKVMQEQKPDRQLLLYTSPSVKYAINTEIFLAQFKYCLVHQQKDECYDELKRILSEQYGEYQIQILERQFKQVNLSRMKIF